MTIVPKKVLIHEVAPPYSSGNVHLGHILEATYWSVMGKILNKNNLSSLGIGESSPGPKLSWGCDVNGSPIVRKVATPGMSKEALFSACDSYSREMESIMKKTYEQWGLLDGYEEVDYYRTDDEQMATLLKKFVQRCKTLGIIGEDWAPRIFCKSCGTDVTKIECEAITAPGREYQIAVWDRKGREYAIMTTHPELIYGLHCFSYRKNDPRYTHLEGQELSFTPNFLEGTFAPVHGTSHISSTKGTGLCYIAAYGSTQDIEVLRELGHTTHSKLYEACGTPLGKTDMTILKINSQRAATVGSVIHSQRQDCRRPVIYVTKKSVVISITDQIRARLIQRLDDLEIKVESSRVQDQKSGKYFDLARSLVKNMDNLSISRDPARYYSLELPNYPNYVAYTWLISCLLTQRLDGRYHRFFGAEIQNAWVLRTLLVEEIMDNRRLAYVVRHGLILDSQGRKISKSLKNGPDYSKLALKYGKSCLKRYLLSHNWNKNLVYDQSALESWDKVDRKLFALNNLVTKRITAGEDGELLVELPPRIELQRRIRDYLEGDNRTIDHSQILNQIKEQVYEISRRRVVKNLSLESWSILQQRVNQLLALWRYYE